MERCKPVRTLFDAKLKLLKFSSEEFRNTQRKMKGVSYKARVGSFMYAMVGTRADIAFAVCMVSQFMLKASPHHWMAMKHVMGI